MKQKRKEKSLFLSKIGLNEVGAISLLGILGGVLCLASIGLQNRSVIAADGDISTMNLSYDGVDDNVEVVYDVSFLKDGQNDVVLSNVYKVGSSVYVAPNSVAVNPQRVSGERWPSNEVIDGVYGHILGGKENKLSSSNVTMIAGYDNRVNTGNVNSIVLGGKGNRLEDGNGTRTAILLGGIGNRILNSNEKVGIIGGEGNIVQGSASSVTILGGEGNVVEGANAIVGGSDVNVPSNAINIFAFSDKTAGLNISSEGLAEKGKGSDSFYLNVENGVGINVEPGTNGVETSGAVGFGDINIEDPNNKCTQDNYGVQGTWNGCLVGCTSESADNGGSWELLDSSENCKDVLCEDPDIHCPDPVPDPKIPGNCIGNLVVNDRMQICDNLDATKFYNTSFEKVLVDIGKCPEGNQDLVYNQCVYHCKSDYHLVINELDSMGGKTLVKGQKGCYKDCELPWDPTKSEKHGGKITGYTKSQVTCSNDENNPASYQSCTNYDNMAELLCVDGDWYNVTKSEWKKAGEYDNELCELKSYSGCEGLGYGLSSSSIKSGKYGDNVTWNDTDRGDSTGTRGVYTLCKNRTAVDPTKNGTTCTSKDPDQYKYKIKECNTDYSTGSAYPNQCRKMCRGRDGKRNILDGTTDTVFLSSAPVCYNSSVKCESVSVTCVDGEWKNGNTTMSEIWTCNTQTHNACNGYEVKLTSYNLLLHSYSTVGYNPVPCTWYSTSSDRQSCNTEYNYKFEGCPDGYSTETVLHGEVNVCQKIPTCGGKYECGNDGKIVESTKKETVIPATAEVETGYVWNWDCKGEFNLGNSISCEATSEGQKKCGNGKIDEGETCANCSDDVGACQCTGTLPDGASRNNYDTPSTNTSLFCSPSSTAACSFTCGGNQVCDGTTKCKDPDPDGGKCTGDLPDGASRNNYDTPSTDTALFCSPSSTAACSFTCGGNQVCDGTTGCKNIPGQCTITYDANGGEISSGKSKATDTISCGVQVTLKKVLNSDKFEGWYTAASGGTKIGGVEEKYKLDKDITVYAHWKTDSHVCQGKMRTGATLNNPNASPSNDTTNYFCDATSTAACAYTCESGQVCNDDKTGCMTPTYSCQGTMPDGATVNNPNASPYSNINYFCDANTVAACAYTCPSGSKCNGSKTGCDPVPQCTGTKPTGATLNNTGAVLYADTDYFCDATSTAACSYTCGGNQVCDGTTGCKDPDPEQCTITYKINGGKFKDNNTDDKTYDHTCGTEITLWGVLNSDKFEGWYTAASGGTKIGGAEEKYTLNDNKTAYAHWKAKCTGNVPSGATKSTVAPKEDKEWSCATDTTAACSFTCPGGKQCNSSNTGCEDIPNNDCDPAEHKFGECSFDIPKMSDGGSKTIYYESSNKTMLGELGVKCSKGAFEYTSQSCNKLVPCSESGAPANASYSGVQVSVTWDGTSWTSPATCSWSCNYGYCEKSGQCVAATKTMSGTQVVYTCPSGGSCFPAGTQIVMADGTKKIIENVNEGDMVLSYDPEKNTNESNMVKRLIIHEDNIHEMYELTINGKVLRVTDVHPFYVKRSLQGEDYDWIRMRTRVWNPVILQGYDWIEAQDLKVGDKLLMTDGSLVEIEEINHYSNQETVYNLEVDGNHNYFVDEGYLVHNKGGGGGGGGGSFSGSTSSGFSRFAWCVAGWTMFC